MKKATLNFKVEQVKNTLAMFKGSAASVIIDYRGLNVAEISRLRRNLHLAGCEMKVIKNNILRRAAAEAGYREIDNFFVGPTAVAFSEEAGTAPKTVFDFARKNTKIKVKAGVIGGKVMSGEDLKVFAALPDKPGMISMLLSLLQAPIRNLGCALKAVAEKEA